MIENKIKEGDFMEKELLTREQKLIGLTKLNWVAQQWPERVCEQLTRILEKNPKGLLPLFMTVAIESGPPIGDIAAEWLEKNPDRELARVVLDQSNASSEALKELRKVAAKIVSAE